MTIIAKDVGIVMDEARLHLFPAPLCSVAEQVFTACLGAGMAREDDGLAVKLWESFGLKNFSEKGSIEEAEAAAKELTIQSSGTPKKVLFIGIGSMGAGMASSIQKAGPAVVGYDIDAGAAEAFVSAGGVTTTDPIAEARDADVVVLMPLTAVQAEASLFGADGASGLAAGEAHRPVQS
jgi:3-hydroxyisobutyrate dehydrogenase-like beta-hydroxyacid dehydrogenase